MIVSATQDARHPATAASAAEPPEALERKVDPHPAGVAILHLEDRLGDRQGKCLPARGAHLEPFLGDPDLVPLVGVLVPARKAPASLAVQGHRLALLPALADEPLEE